MKEEEIKRSASREGGEEKKPRKPYARPQGDFHGERKGNGGFSKSGTERKFYGEKKTFGGNDERFSREKREFSGVKTPSDAGRDVRAPGGARADSAKVAEHAHHAPMNGKREGFGGEGRRADAPRRPYGGERRAAPHGAPTGNTKPPVRHGQTDGLPARRLALDIIRQVTENGAYASLALDEKLHACTLSHEDRRLVSRLVYDTLENLLYLDHAIGQVMAKADTDIKLRNVLRLGACQILLEDRIPESAATNTSVNLCKEIGMEGLGGVCNGILRNLIRQKDSLTWPSETENQVLALSIRHSVPQWLVEKLLADWGYDGAVALMSRHHENNYITVRPNLMQLSDEGFETLLQQKVWQHEKGPVAHSVRVRGMAEIAHDAGFVGGKFSIQGESSMMACMALNPQRGWNILDACAAPGGKSCYLAEMMGGTGRVQAWDVHPHRVDLIEAQVRRLGLENVRPLVRDGRRLREDMVGMMDAVLLDAPCSGTGDMLDKPDVKYRVTPESLNEILKTQYDLLETVCQYVRRGGVMVYSTCSVLKDENERQVGAFLSRHPEFTLEVMPQSIPEQFRAHEQLGLQLLPGRDDVGGFYIARLRRKRV